MPSARIMLNQPLGGCQGASLDVQIQAAEQSRNIKVAQEVLVRATGATPDQVAEMLDRETFMGPEEAVARGIIDAVVTR